MKERERLARAAAAEPHDDLPRLVLADWLEEHGEAGRAAFLRAGVALARMDDADERYPATLASYFRSATFAAAPSEPWLDNVPGMNTYWIRGMIGGVVGKTEDY